MLPSVTLTSVLKRLQDALSTAKLAELDELPWHDRLDFIANETGWEHWDCWDALILYRQELRQKSEPPASPELWLRTAQQALDALPLAPVALQAIWDGDTAGWMLVVSAILPQPSDHHPRFTEVHLVTMRGAGGDSRLFSGAVPPWPECEVAKEIGRRVTQRWNVPFHFPSPEKPELDDAYWWDVREG